MRDGGRRVGGPLGKVLARASVSIRRWTPLEVEAWVVGSALTLSMLAFFWSLIS